MRLLAAAVLAAVLLAACDPGPQAPVVDTAGVQSLIARGEAVLVDVRERTEVRTGVIAGAINLPYSRFAPAQLPPPAPGRTVVILCEVGSRSRVAAAVAAASGRADVVNYRGSMDAWRRAGGPVVPPAP